MPTNVIRSPRDERLWTKAKGIAKKQYNISSGDRFYSIVMGIYKKMKGGSVSKTGSINKEALPMGLFAGIGKRLMKSPTLRFLKGVGKTGWNLWYPLDYLAGHSRSMMPGKGLKLMSSAWRKAGVPAIQLAKAGALRKKAFNYSSAPAFVTDVLVPLLVSATAAAGTIGGAKIYDRVTSRRAFERAKQKFPDLKKYPKEKLESQFSVIRDMAPELSKNPYVLGSILRETAQYDATGTQMLNALSQIQARKESVPYQVSGMMQPAVKQISSNILHSMREEDPEVEKQRQIEIEEAKSQMKLEKQKEFEEFKKNLYGTRVP